MHPNNSTSSLRSKTKRGISHHNVSGQLPKSRTRAGKNSNRPERRPPAYEDVSAGSDTLSSSEGDDQLSARANSWSPPNFVEFDAFQQADTNRQPPPDFAHSSVDGAFQWNQELFEQIPAATGPPAAAGPTLEPARYGYVNVPHSVMGEKYNPTPAGNPRPQAQVFFAAQQNTGPATSSSNGLMLTSAYYGNGSQVATAPMTPIQPTNNGGMNAHTINNHYHINSLPNLAQFTGGYSQTQPITTQWPANTGLNPVANPQAYCYLQASTPPQIPVYGRLSANVPPTPNFYQDSWHGPTSDTYGPHKYQGPAAAYSNFIIGHGTRIQAPCTLMSSGPVPVVPCLHHVVQADALKNRLISDLPTQMHTNTRDKPPEESAMSRRQQNASNYGENLANGYRISISGLKNYISSNTSRTLPRHSSDVVDEKGSTTMINRRSPPAIYCVRGIKLFIICCLVAMLLSMGLLLHPEWLLGGFTL